MKVWLILLMGKVPGSFCNDNNYPASIFDVGTLQVLAHIREILQHVFITKNQAKDGLDIAEAAARQVVWLVVY